VLDFKPILFITGVLMLPLAVAMCLPAVADAAANNPDWQVFLTAAVFTLFVGGTLALSSRGAIRTITPRQGFVLTTMLWIVIPAFAALPFAFADMDLSYTDAFFESMSGLTTTGSTVIQSLDVAPPGVLIWRALLQWLGGIGVIAMAIAILPLLRIGGMQLFRMESSDRSEKATPRTTQLVAYISFIYLVVSLVCAFAYWSAGMSGFDAMAHAMTTIATGGYSTYDASIAHFGSATIEYIAIVFMLIGSLPFVLYLRALRGNTRSLFRDDQVRLFLLIVVVSIFLVTYYRYNMGVEIDTALREAAFNVVSIITGTGYATSDYGAWGSFGLVIFFFLMFVGGCAGSTTCGVKIFRFQVLYATAVTQIRRLLEPHGVYLAYYNRKPIPDEVSASVMAFFFLYVLSYAVIAIALGLIGVDFLTAASGAATAISNVGPGLGPTIGPSGTFATLPDGAKWVLSAGMLLGRLELFTVLVLLLPSFWRD
jgi:trk system potassium uptake protein TrkH|tara:strand:+ start:75 stop:1520 length:1446 start_codon:yes stop_codon:yes gene_type:complete